MRRLLFTLLVVLIALPGCGTTPLPPEMPSDFVVGMRSKEQLNPPIDFRVLVKRTGSTSWESTVRAPTRKAYSGELSLKESQIRELYQLVLAANYASLDETYKAEVGAPERSENGNRIFWVEALGTDQRVDIDYMDLPAVQPLHDMLLSLIPQYAITGVGGPDDGMTPTDRFVADRSTRRFHHPDCEHAQGIAADDRETFQDWEDALNFKFDPCPVCKPMDLNK